MIEDSVINFLKQEGFKQSELFFDKEVQISGNQISLRLEFSDMFPQKLPIVRVLNGKDLPLLPHLEENGKICLFQDGANVVDISRPIEIINITLGKAIQTIESGFSDNRKNELVSEFVAYWGSSKCKGSAISILSANETPRPLFAAMVDSNELPFKRDFIFADNNTDLEKFLNTFGVKKYSKKYAYYIPLGNVVEPPHYQEDITVESVLAFVSENASIGTYNDLNNFLKSSKLPLNLVFSIPNEPLRVLYALMIMRANDRKKVEKGFRASKVNASHEINFVKNKFIDRISLKRFDPDYLLKRSGATDSLRDINVLLIGCGSVGGYVAEYMRGAGIGFLHIIDNDTLTNENLHRHCLGVKYVGKNKAEALKHYLDDKFITGQAVAYNLDGYGDIKSNFKKLDLVVDVSGDENLNLKNNRSFSKDTTMIYGWVEPLGLGHHIVSSNIEKKIGCLECLYTSNDGNFSPNRAFFSEPSQNVRRVHAGCSGSFLPYSNLDAIRLATDITKVAIEIMSGKRTGNFLRSYFGKKEVFLSEGFNLSKRSNLFNEEEFKETGEFVSKFCKSCGD